MILIIDNYDSFTYNLYQYAGEICSDVEVVRNDELDAESAINSGAERIILSPGPGRPEDAGICVDLVRKSAGRIPILGICLGHQAIGAAYGAEVAGAEKIFHGKTSRVFHSGRGIFRGVKSPITAMRYHSLVIKPDSVPDELEITARTGDGVIMGIRHRIFPVYGVQFHPESIFTEDGKKILKNFLEGDGCV
ncbi:MAG: aminodeoxychorismate/anthranilate synthase component II [Tepidanaerobacteraceae bacterium]|nr:aminodeoxychorismate/anthranilate synthase component II [Tepidanaerobacteraceae bacterium]